MTTLINWLVSNGGQQNFIVSVKGTMDKDFSGNLIHESIISATYKDILMLKELLERLLTIDYSFDGRNINEKVYELYSENEFEFISKMFLGKVYGLQKFYLQNVMPVDETEFGSLPEAITDISISLDIGL